MVRVNFSLRSILTGLGCIGIGNGLTSVLIPTKAVHLGFPTFTIGILTGFYYLGFITSCFLTPRLVKRAGHIRAFISAAAVLGICTLGYTLTDFSAAWMVFRVASGFCVACIYMITESWINGSATTTNRGRIVTVYRMVDLLAMVIGQVTMGAFTMGGSEAFIVANLLITAGVIPLALTTARGPQPITSVTLNWTKIFSTSRIAGVACLSIGLSTGAFYGMGPAFVRTLGFPVEAVGWFMASAISTGVIFQIGVGMLADRFDRERLITFVAMAAALSGLLLVLIDRTFLHLVLAVSLWGGLTMPLYSLAIAIANDRCDQSEFLEVSGGLLLIYSIGAALGPSLSSIIMQFNGPSSLFGFTAAAHSAFAIYAFGRRTFTIQPVPLSDREDFVTIPRTTPVILEIDPRSDAQ